MPGVCRAFYFPTSSGAPTADSFGIEKTRETMRKIFRLIGEVPSSTAAPTHGTSRDAFVQELREISEAEDVHGSDFLLLYVLSHGHENEVLTEDQPITVTEMLGFFHEDRCPRFRGKPKIVILQSCRGEQVEGSVAESAHPREKVRCRVGRSGPLLQSELNERQEKMGLNFFLIYPNPPGNKAYGSSSGSDFTIALGEAVETHVKPGEEITWTKLMTHVNQRYIARHQMCDQDFAGIAFVSNTFTKNFIVGQGCDRQ